MPEFIKLLKIKEEETRVEVYRGKEGLKTILKDILRTGRDYIVFGEEGRFQKILPIASHQFLRQIEKSNVHEKVLVREDFKSKILKTKNSIFKYLSTDYLSPAMTVVYGNKVAIFIWTQPYYVTLIKNKEVADSFRSHFKVLWKIAKR